MDKINLKVKELNQIERSKAAQIEATFAPMVEMLEGIEIKYHNILEFAKGEITNQIQNEAKKLRLEIARIRVSTEKARKEQKRQYLLAGKAIDGTANILKWAISEKEDALKNIEKHFEILEAKRLEAVKIERQELLAPYVENAHELELQNMDSEVWEIYLEKKKKDHADKIEAEKQAAKEAKEREAEKERERQELKAKLKEAEKERKKQEAEKLEIARKLKAQENKAKRLQKEKETIAKNATDEAAVLMAKLRKERQEKTAARLEKEKNSNLSEIDQIIKAIEAVKMEPVKVSSLELKDVQKDILQKLEGFKAWAVHKLGKRV